MKNNFILLLFCLITFLSAQTIDWSWVESTGGVLQDYGSSVAITAEAIYVTGSFKISSMFGTTELESNGGYDIFVSKMDIEGNWLWAVSAGGSTNDFACDIALDSEENIYLIGRFSGEIDFGQYHLNGSGSFDIFVAKLDLDGNWLWAVRAGGNDLDYGESIAIDSENCIYITGSFWDTAAFGDSIFISAGADDIYISKLNSNGEWLWSQQCSGEYRDAGIALEVDEYENICFSGGFHGPTNFGPFVLSGNSYNDIFIAKLDETGDWLMLLEVLSSNNSIAVPRSLDLDSDNSVIITGEFSESLYFGLPSMTLESCGQRDIFLAKLNSDFTWEWTTSAGGTGDDCGNSVEVDSNGNIWLTGCFSNTAEFGYEQFVSAGETDVFVSILDSDGNWLITEQAGGNSEDIGNALAINNSDEIILTGYFGDTASFGGISVTSNGNDDFFVCAINHQTFANDLLIPKEIFLTNFPNPFNPFTTISFSLTAKDAQDAKIEIYNLKGQKVKVFTFPSGSCPIGTSEQNLQITQSPNHQIVWDGTDQNNKPVSSGVYLYKLKAGEFEDSRKMLMLK
ncbi:MAG: hypothetical protein Q7J16_07520 [Candidatus Cloacimonadales bacterium]|nr:hypothetical protein [Candidatus Cloacimonadales bacterium]